MHQDSFLIIADLFDDVKEFESKISGQFEICAKENATYNVRLAIELDKNRFESKYLSKVLGECLSNKTYLIYVLSLKQTTTYSNSSSSQKMAEVDEMLCEQDRAWF